MAARRPCFPVSVPAVTDAAVGIAIGLAFQVSSSTGLTVALAVIGHDFADGINTMALMLAHGNRL